MLHFVEIDLNSNGCLISANKTYNKTDLVSNLKVVVPIDLEMQAVFVAYCLLQRLAVVHSKKTLINSFKF